MRFGNTNDTLFRTIPMKLMFLVFAVLLFLHHPGEAALDEGRVRAAVIFHIVSLTQWPGAHAEPSQSRNFSPSIILLGKDPFGIADVLSRNMRENPSSTNKIILQVTSLKSPGDVALFENILATNQILYLTSDGMQYLPQIAHLLKKRPILTIGETESFCENGLGMVCLTTESQRLIIHINNKLSTDIGFYFSAELLRHAILVTP
jgi:hypothetical protein